MIHREIFPVIPPKVEYSLTEKGRKAIPVIETIMKYGYDLIQDEGIVFRLKMKNRWEISQNIISILFFFIPSHCLK
jgi:DNA-binding HxlR family transcriptional regulator